MGGAEWRGVSSLTRRQRRKRRQKQQKALITAFDHHLQQAGVYEATTSLDEEIHKHFQGVMPEDSKLAVMMMRAMAAQAQGIELPAEAVASVSHLQQLFEQEEADVEKDGE